LIDEWVVVFPASSTRPVRFAVHRTLDARLTKEPMLSRTSSADVGRVVVAFERLATAYWAA
jgi:hypothetical protein